MRKQELQAQEIETMAEQKENKVELKLAQRKLDRDEKKTKKEIISDTKAGDFGSVQEKAEQFNNAKSDSRIDGMQQRDQDLQAQREEIKRQIEICEQEYDRIKEERKSVIKELSEDRNNKLATNQKQNFFQRAMGSIMDKINGGKKFVKSVINPLKDKISVIKNEKIPQIKESLGQKGKEILDKVQGIKETIKEGAKETYRDVVVKGKEIKERIVQGAENKVNEKQAKLDEKKQKLMGKEGNQKSGQQRVTDGMEARA